MLLDPALHIAIILSLVFVTMAAFAWERFTLEVVALAALSFMLVFYQLFPVIDDAGNTLVTTQKLLSGFANPSLVAVLALLIIGQGLVQTNALRPAIRLLEKISGKKPVIGITIALAVVLIISGLLNNTPLVIIFIPIMQTLAVKGRIAPASIMMPLSYVAILGGMTTLVGSSTNLLVSSALTDMGRAPLGFFSFIVPGSILAGAGFVYVMLVLPHLLPKRSSLAHEFAGSGKQFIAELQITTDGPFAGTRITAGRLERGPDITVRQIQRGGVVLGPPFDAFEIQAGDLLIVAASRQALEELLASAAGAALIPGALASIDSQTHGQTPAAGTPNDDATPLSQLGSERLLAEVMIAPASRLADRTLDQLVASERISGIVLGIQRRARMVRGRISDIRLQPGDVLLIMASRELIRSLESNSDLLVLARSLGDMPIPGRAPHAIGVFLTAVGLSALEILPIAVSAVAGATAMVVLGCLNIRQAVRSIDRTIVMLVAASLAMGLVMQETGAAALVANGFFELTGHPGPALTASLLFLVVAIATNLLSNNACAVLFTPIALNLANKFGLEPSLFAVTVVLAANCSFASPIGYQTNLLIMGPGNYRFIDFFRGGAPLVLLLWLIYSLIVPIMIGLTEPLPLSP